MTQHSESRISLRELRVSVRCTRCAAEMIIDPSNETQRERIAGTAKMQCNVCHTEFPQETVQALDDFGRAVLGGGEGKQITLVARYLEGKDGA
jgi:hypothetical protein